ncbi:MAG: hypothetical protein IKI08_08050 [Selenomonadaceae bacterium]|nr:hypothetical protein [Selenomonadaceae bacterium]MBR7025938.1 hypothetical protein [Selenomonadaceae bacterium]
MLTAIQFSFAKLAANKRRCPHECPTQKQLFKRLAKKFKDKTLISKDNFILVHGQPVHDICLSANKNILMSSQGIGGIGAKKFCLAHQQKQLPNELDPLNFLIAVSIPTLRIISPIKALNLHKGSFSELRLLSRAHSTKHQPFISR